MTEHTTEKDAHLSPQACSRCNPLACACWCHREHAPLRTYIEDNGVGKQAVALCSCSEWHVIPPSEARADG